MPKPGICSSTGLPDRGCLGYDEVVADLQEIRDWIEQAERIVVLTGAGISTDSAIPCMGGLAPETRALQGTDG